MSNEQNALKPARPHSQILGQLVHERINKKQLLTSSGKPTSEATTADGVPKKKFKTVGYLPGGVPINKPVAEDVSVGDLSAQADYLLSGYGEDELQTVKSLLTPTELTISEQGSGQAGFYCSACDVLCKDYSSYLSHLSSRNHLKITGQTLKLEKSSLENIQHKLNSLKKPKTAEDHHLLLQERWKKLEKEQAEKLAKAKFEKKEKKLMERTLKESETNENSFGELLEAGFGFGSFGKSR